MLFLHAVQLRVLFSWHSQISQAVSSTASKKGQKTPISSPHPGTGRETGKVKRKQALMDFRAAFITRQEQPWTPPETNSSCCSEPTGCAGVAGCWAVFTLALCCTIYPVPFFIYRTVFCITFLSLDQPGNRGKQINRPKKMAIYTVIYDEAQLFIPVCVCHRTN